MFLNAVIFGYSVELALYRRSVIMFILTYFNTLIFKLNVYIFIFGSTSIKQISILLKLKLHQYTYLNRRYLKDCFNTLKLTNIKIIYL